MDTPDDYRAIAEDAPECPACGQDLLRVTGHLYRRTCRCTDAQVEAAEAGDDD